MADTEYLIWLASLKPGDEVLISDRGLPRISKVTGTTPKRIRAGHSEFHKDGRRAGQRLGDATSWSWAILRPVTQEDRDEIETKMLRAKMREGVVLQNLTLAQLRAIDAIVSESQP